MIFQPEIIAVILVIFGIGISGIIEAIKGVLKAVFKIQTLGVIGNNILSFVISFGATAIYLIKTDAFEPWALIGYGLFVFGESTGLYKIVLKSTTR